LTVDGPYCANISAVLPGDFAGVVNPNDFSLVAGGKGTIAAHSMWRRGDYFCVRTWLARHLIPKSPIKVMEALHKVKAIVMNDIIAGQARSADIKFFPRVPAA